jgi:hypothetical protein
MIVGLGIFNLKGSYYHHEGNLAKTFPKKRKRKRSSQPHCLASQNVMKMDE